MKIYNRFNDALILEIEGASLEGANLEGAYLRGTNFINAKLMYANLEGAYLKYAKLEGASLGGASLEGADLRGASLRGAYLRGANLEGANLRGANLEGAYLWNVIGNGIEVRSQRIGRYTVVVYNDIVQIGCNQYTLNEWLSFSDEQIADMDTNALDWWNTNKELVIEFAKPAA